MLEKHERKTEQKEMLKDTKEKVTKTSKALTEESDKEDLKKDTDEKLAKIKKSDKGLKRKLNAEKKKE